MPQHSDSVWFRGENQSVCDRGGKCRIVDSQIDLFQDNRFNIRLGFVARHPIKHHCPQNRRATGIPNIRMLQTRHHAGTLLWMFGEKVFDKVVAAPRSQTQDDVKFAIVNLLAGRKEK